MRFEKEDEVGSKNEAVKEHSCLWLELLRLVSSLSEQFSSCSRVDSEVEISRVKPNSLDTEDGVENPSYPPGTLLFKKG